MTMTRTQKFMLGVVLATAMLLAASIRTSCFSDGAGTIQLPTGKDKYKGVPKKLRDQASVRTRPHTTAFRRKH
jgi:hypothetical protein